MKKLITILCLIVSESAVAAYPIEKLDDFRSIFTVQQETLTQLRDGLPLASNDWDAAMTIDEIATEVDNRLELLVDLGLLYTAMHEAKDARIVAKLIVGKKLRHQTACERNIKYLNKTLARVNSKAVVNTGEKLRENIQQSCEIGRAHV